MLGAGKYKIANNDNGAWPRTIPVTATVLSLWFLTKPFHVACSNAATKTTANTIPSML